jgi:hypothetical protein
VSASSDTARFLVGWAAIGALTSLFTTAAHSQTGTPATFSVLVTLVRPVKCSTAPGGLGVQCDRGPAPQAATQGSVAERSSPVVLSYRLFDGVPVGVPPPPREAVSEASRHYLPVEWTVRLVGEGLGSYLEFSLAW